MKEQRKKKKVALRIVNHSDIYKNDYEKLIQLDLTELVRLQLILLIPLSVKFAYKRRHN